MNTESMLEKANMCLELGQYNEAASVFSSILLDQTEHVEALVGRGICRYECKQWESSEIDLKKAILIDEENSRAYYFLGRIYSGSDRINEAIQMFTKAIIVDNEDYHSYLRRAELYEDQGEQLLAINDYSKCIENDRFVDKSLYRRGLMRMDLEQWESAVRDFSTIGSEFKNRSEMLYNLAISEGNLGRIESQITHLIESLSLDPDNWDAHYNLALLYINKGDKNKAQSVLKTIVSGTPGSLNATHALELLSDIEKQ